MLPPAHVLMLSARVVHCVCDQVGRGLAVNMLPPAHILVLSLGGVCHVCGQVLMTHGLHNIVLDDGLCTRASTCATAGCELCACLQGHALHWQAQGQMQGVQGCTVDRQEELDRVRPLVSRGRWLQWMV